jgi:hypothetical protein
MTVFGSPHPEAARATKAKPNSRKRKGDKENSFQEKLAAVANAASLFLWAQWEISRFERSWPMK